MPMAVKTPQKIQDLWAAYLRLPGYVTDILLPTFLALGAVGIFAAALPRVNLDAMTDLGLVSVLPPYFYVALLFLGIGYLLALNRPDSPEWLLAIQLVILIFILYGVTSFVEDVPRFNVTWRHSGVVDYILREKNLALRTDVYFSWPGFFILNAFLVRIAGLQSPLQYASWFPVLLNLLHLGPLYIIFRSVSNDRRLVWLSLWIFYITNWVGQDYFSPQGFTYFLYMVVIGILLRWFQIGPPEKLIDRLEIRFGWFEKIAYYFRARPSADQQSSPSQRAGLLTITLLIVLVVVGSHQLTPYALIFTIAAVTLFWRISTRGLIIILGMMVIGWTVFFASGFMATHLDPILASFGQVEDVVSASVLGRLHGSPGHEFIVRLRIFITILVWGLAFLGGLRRIRNGQLDLSMALMAAAPFALVGLQLYGGEMLLRVYIFNLPFMAFFIAALFYPKIESRLNLKQGLLLGLVTVVLLGSFHPVRYGNESSEQYSINEIEVVRRLYEIAPKRSLFAAANPHYPIKYQDYEDHPQRFLANQILTGDIEGIVEIMENTRYSGAYLVITRSQEAYFRIFYDYPTENWAIFEQQLVDTGRFELIYSNNGGRIYKLLPKNN